MTDFDIRVNEECKNIWTKSHFELRQALRSLPEVLRSDDQIKRHALEKVLTFRAKRSFKDPEDNKQFFIKQHSKRSYPELLLLSHGLERLVSEGVYMCQTQEAELEALRELIQGRELGVRTC